MGYQAPRAIARIAIACIALGGTLAACDGGPESAQGGAAPAVKQTGFPGQVSAGSATGGEIMARNTATAQGGNQASEGQRGQAPQGAVSGTPSIPEGAGGTPSGAEMGGTTPGAATSQTPPPSVVATSGKDAAEADAQKKQQAAAQIEQEKLDLANAMDRVASRWHSRAAADGARPVPTEVLPGFRPQGQPQGQPDMPIRSEKRGTAPPSTDVKDPSQKGK